MKNPQKITDPFVIKLLKKYRFYKKIVVNDEIDYAKIYDKFKAKEEVLFSFACELLQKFISTQSITEIYKGFEGYTYGLSSSYPVYQVSKLINLYNKFNSKETLFEIGTKRCNRNKVIKIIEDIIKEPLTNIGNVLIFNSLYDVLQSEKTNIVVSAYTEEMSRWEMVNNKTGKTLGLMVSTSSYMGIIVPGFELAREIAKAICEKSDNSEVEFPFNCYGGMSITDLTRTNITPAQAKRNETIQRKKPIEERDYNEMSAFVLQINKPLKVKELLVTN